MLLFRENYGGVTETFLYQEHGGAGVRRSWKRMLGRLALLKSGLKDLLIRFSGLTGPSLW